jgi:amphi-Trp domain-containing protein
MTERDVLIPMPEKVLFESESPRSRAEIAAYFRQIADSLEGGGAITLSAGDQSVTMDPPDRPTFEVKAEREGPAGGAGELSVEFELEWDENGDDDGELEIE